MWGSGVLGSSKGKEDTVPDGAVPHVYFPMRKGCRVTMYNDAHQVSPLLHCLLMWSGLSCPISYEGLVSSAYLLLHAHKLQGHHVQ